MKEKYLHRVRLLLDGTPEEKARLLKRLDKGITAYLEENPEATREQLYEVFGTPEKCALELSKECSPPLLKKIKIERRRKYILYGSLLTLFVVALCVIGYIWTTYGKYGVIEQGTYLGEEVSDNYFESRNEVIYHYEH